MKNQITKWHNEVPNIKPYYAVKSLPLENIIKHLASSNVNFDCASSNEIASVLKFSNPQNIVFANPSKSLDDIKYANDRNVNVMVVDSIEEIIKMDSINPNLKKIIRIKSVENDSDIKFNSKFGATEDEVYALLDYIVNNKIKNYSDSFEGFSFHVGSKCKNEESYFLTIKNIFDNYFNYCIKKNLKIKIIDIGGGFTSYTNLTGLYKILDPFYEQLKEHNIKLIAEPGRYFAEPSIDLYCKVIAVKKRNNCYHITINDSVYSTFNGKLFDGQKYTPIPLWDSTDDEWVDCIIFGQTCDSIDVICQHIKLPLPKIGNVFKFQNIGAYSLAACYGKFNGFSEPKPIELE